MTDQLSRHECETKFGETCKHCGIINVRKPVYYGGSGLGFVFAMFGIMLLMWRLLS